MKKLKSLWKNYKKPTPDKWRKIGDSILAVSLFLTTTTVSIPHIDKWIPFTAAALGIIGKFLTNFFAPNDGGKAE